MKDSDGIVLFIFGVVVAIGIFMGVKMFAAKAFSTPPPENPNAERSHHFSEQKQRARDVKMQQEQMKRMQEQRMRDLKRQSN